MRERDVLRLRGMIVRFEAQLRLVWTAAIGRLVLKKFEREIFVRLRSQIASASARI